MRHHAMRSIYNLYQESSPHYRQINEIEELNKNNNCCFNTWTPLINLLQCTKQNSKERIQKHLDFMIVHYMVESINQ